MLTRPPLARRRAHDPRSNRAAERDQVLLEATDIVLQYREHVAGDRLRRGLGAQPTRHLAGRLRRLLEQGPLTLGLRGLGGLGDERRRLLEELSEGRGELAWRHVGADQTP